VHVGHGTRIKKSTVREWQNKGSGAEAQVALESLFDSLSGKDLSQ